MSDPTHTLDWHLTRFRKGMVAGVVVAFFLPLLQPGNDQQAYRIGLGVFTILSRTVEGNADELVSTTRFHPLGVILWGVVAGVLWWAVSSVQFLVAKKQI